MSRVVLIVEDDMELQELYGIMLEGQDWLRLPAYDGEEALEYLETRSIDLILLDIIMDEMMGDEFYRRLRRDDRFARVPVIVLSVLPVDSLEKLTGGDARARHLRKPFQRRQLLDTIDLLLAPGVPG